MSEQPDESRRGGDFQRAPLGFQIAIFIGMTSLGFLAFDEPVHAWFAAHVTTLISQQTMVWIFAVAVLVHVFEASVAYRLARRRGSHSVGAWTLQTMVFGYPSLRILLARRN